MRKEQHLEPCWAAHEALGALPTSTHALLSLPTQSLVPSPVGAQHLADTQHLHVMVSVERVPAAAPSQAVGPVPLALPVACRRLLRLVHRPQHLLRCGAVWRAGGGAVMPVCGQTQHPYGAGSRCVVPEPNERLQAAVQQRQLPHGESFGGGASAPHDCSLGPLPAAAAVSPGLLWPGRLLLLLRRFHPYGYCLAGQLGSPGQQPRDLAGDISLAAVLLRLPAAAAAGRSRAHRLVPVQKGARAVPCAASCCW